MAIEWVLDEETAKRLEMAYIEAEQPLYNKKLKKGFTEEDLENIAIDMLVERVSKKSVVHFLRKLTKQSSPIIDRLSA